MKSLLPSMILALGVFYGCSSSNITRPDYGHFMFEYDNKTYHIYSQLTSNVEGGNSLWNDDRSIIAVDNDQNGTLDIVIKNNVGLKNDVLLEKMQEVYLAGLGKLAEQNLLFESDAINRYKTWIDENSFTITHCNKGKDCRIELFGTLVDGDIVYGYDNKSDGSLDNILRGKTSPTVLQGLYDKLLLKGIKEGAIEKIGDKYQILHKQ